MPRASTKKTASAPNGRTLVILGLIVVGVGILLSRSLTKSASRVVLHTPNQDISSRVVDTDQLRQQGLSGKMSLGRNDSMLFVFDSEDYQGFWMKDMKFPIDMVWLDSNKKVVTVRQNLAPESYPSVFYPGSPAQYVVELSSGRAKELGITVGSALAW